MKVVTDGGADLPSGFADAYDVTIVPLHVLFGTESFRSDVELDADRFYQILAESRRHPTTSQPTPDDFRQAYEGARKEGHREIISVHISSGLSGTIQSARQAAADVEGVEVTIVDSHTLSLAQGFQVMVAAAALKAGHTREATLGLIEQTARVTELFFTLDTLDYLVKGGRVGRVRGLVGSLLGIKPIITVDKEPGTYVPAGTARTLKKATQTMAELAARVVSGGAARVAVIHANAPHLAEDLETELSGRLQPVWMQRVRTTPTLGVHTGPCSAGVVVAPGHWPAGLNL